MARSLCLQATSGRGVGGGVVRGAEFDVHGTGDVTGGELGSLPDINRPPHGRR